MPRVMNLPTVSITGAQVVANSSVNQTGKIPTSEFATAGSVTTITTQLNYGVTTVDTDADATLTWGTENETVIHTGTLTADRAITLATSGAVDGARFRIIRTGSGAFNLDIGTGPLAAMRQNMWAEFVYDGAAWFLAEHGVKSTSAYAQTILDDADAAAVLTTLGVSAFIQTLLDDTDAATARATLAIPDGVSAAEARRITNKYALIV